MALDGDQVEGAVEGGDRVFPRVRGDGREVRVVFGGVAGEIGREVGAFRLEERLEVGRQRVAVVDVHDVGQVVAGHRGHELGLVIGTGDDVDRHVGVDLAIDFLPRRVLGEGRGRRKIGAVEDVDGAAAARLFGDRFDGVGGVVVETVVEAGVGDVIL